MHKETGTVQLGEDWQADFDRDRGDDPRWTWQAWAGDSLVKVVPDQFDHGHWVEA